MKGIKIIQTCDDHTKKLNQHLVNNNAYCSVIIVGTEWKKPVKLIVSHKKM